MERKWHQQEVNDIFDFLSTSPEGLAHDEAKRRLEENGPNDLMEKSKKPAWVLFLSQFKGFMILVLIAAAIVSGVIGEITDAIIILVIVILNAIVGFIQEYRAEKAMEALKKMATHNSQVIRNNKPIVISSSEIVPGDIVILEAGGMVPADIRLFESHSLRIEEASLTGESAGVDKNVRALEEENLPLGDRFNMAYKSTLVTNGRGKGIVIATGMKTEIGRIATMLQDAESSTPLQLKMADFAKKLSYLIFIICILLFVVGLLRGEEPLNMLLVAISLAVAAIPEALPALITIALARGAQRLVKKNSLIRKLPAVETLGSVTFICTDKTGTLTQNKMTVVQVSPNDQTHAIGHDIPTLELLMALNHDVSKTEDSTLVGDPTEIAVVAYFRDKHSSGVLKNTLRSYPRVAELPFDSDRKRMTTVHRNNDKFIAITKGAAESVADSLKHTIDTGPILDETDRLSSEGMRVLAYGYRLLDSYEEPLKVEEMERDMEYAGLIGMIDPPREEVKVAIKECKSAGIYPVMITGDHRATAGAIARQIGILGEDDLQMSGDELFRLSPAELDEKVERIKVYSRVSPEQKLNIVKSLQRKHHFVAMTGDGVNDAPSLKAANIGIAMGISGTDVSKEVAHMILLDDNFATIVRAIREGRRIYDNIRKFVKYIMTCNGAEIWTIFFAPLLGLPIPLMPIHILWINLVTDGLPGLALSAEKAEKEIMNRPPRKTDESLFSGGIAYHIIWVGVLMAVLMLSLQAWAMYTGNPRWQTMVFTALSLAQLGHVYAIRSENEFIFNAGFFTNKPLVLAIVGTVLLQLAVVYLPIANDIFKTQPLTISELAICFGAAALIFIAVELEKLVKKRNRKPHHPAGRI